MPISYARLAVLAAGFLAATAGSAAELVTNGNFAAGDTGFSSDYVDRTAGPSGVVNGSYAIGTDAASVPNASFDWGGFGDHTTGTGNMLIADGAAGRGWYVTINLTAGTVYDWSFWAHTMQSNTGPGAILSLQLDGAAIGGSLTMPTSSASTWQQLTGSYTATQTGSIVLSIADLSGAGPYNDYALDDISFASPAGAVPEPATWAMMLAGFGAVGSAVRHRRKVIVNFA